MDKEIDYSVIPKLAYSPAYATERKRLSDGLPLQEWLEKSIFPTETNLTKEYMLKSAHLHQPAEMIKQAQHLPAICIIFQNQ